MSHLLLLWNRRQGVQSQNLSMQNVGDRQQPPRSPSALRLTQEGKGLAASKIMMESE